MKKYNGIDVSDEVWDFIKCMTDYVETKFGFAIESSEHHIYIDPVMDCILIKPNENTVFKYSDLKDFLLNCEIKGKKIIECLEDFDFV